MTHPNLALARWVLAAAAAMSAAAACSDTAQPASPAGAASAGTTADSAGGGADSTSKADTAAMPNGTDTASARVGDAALSTDGNAGGTAGVDSAEDPGGQADATSAVDGPDAAPADSPSAADSSPSGDTNVAPDTGPGKATPDPSAWGPYSVGTRSYAWVDAKRQNRLVTTQIWHPAPPCSDGISYLQLIPGKACGDVGPDKKGAPYPIVLFSHGFKGVNTQSISLIEHLASHGYVVVAPNHVGNTLFDFTAKDKDVANAAIERANDVRFAYDEALKLNDKGDLAGTMDGAKVAMTGHSFGGWTALVVAGGQVDVDAAKAACAAGAKSDIFCKYLGFWPPGSTIKLGAPIPGLKAAIAWAPAGYSSFGDKGLALVKVPVFVMGGTLDNTAPVQWEIDPIYGALPAPKAEVVVQDASHMSFTNICGLPGAELAIKDFCGVKGVAKPADAFQTINTFSTAWLARWVAGDKAMAAWFDPAGKGKVGLTAVLNMQGM